MLMSLLGTEDSLALSLFEPPRVSISHRVVVAQVAYLGDHPKFHRAVLLPTNFSLSNPEFSLQSELTGAVRKHCSISVAIDQS